MGKIMKNKCYQCKHRDSIPGDSHSRCMHPELKEFLESSVGQVLSMFNGRILTPEFSLKDMVQKFDIIANTHGIQKGWFNWPWNFDPLWLINCNRFEEQDENKDN